MALSDPTLSYVAFLVTLEIGSLILCLHIYSTGPLVSSFPGVLSVAQMDL
jgi:hypothetical protein